MARESNLFSWSLPAATGGSLPTQYSAVVVNSSGLAALPAAAGAQIFGIVGNAPGTGAPGAGVTGQSCSIQTSGVAKVLVGSGAGVTVGDQLRTDTSGAAVTNTASSGYYTFGICLETVAASGVTTVALLPGGKA